MLNSNKFSIIFLLITSFSFAQSSEFTVSGKALLNLKLHEEIVSFQTIHIDNNHASVYYLSKIPPLLPPLFCQEDSLFSKTIGKPEGSSIRMVIENETENRISLIGETKKISFFLHYEDEDIFNILSECIDTLRNDKKVSKLIYEDEPSNTLNSGVRVNYFRCNFQFKLNENDILPTTIRYNVTFYAVPKGKEEIIFIANKFFVGSHNTPLENYINQNGEEDSKIKNRIIEACINEVKPLANKFSKFFSEKGYEQTPVIKWPNF